MASPVIAAVAAVSCVAFVLLYADPAERVIGQAVFVASVTAVIVSSLLAVALLSAPFRGGHGSVGPTDMRYTLALVEAEAAALHDPLATPCDAHGVPE